MKTDVINSVDLHFEHVQWQKELLFWEDEIKSFNNHMTELAKRWTDKMVLAQLEHFQKKINHYEEVVISLRHDINAHETNMATNNERGEDALNTVFAKYHFALRERMEIQRNIYDNRKKDFLKFLSTYM